MDNVIIRNSTVEDIDQLIQFRIDFLRTDHCSFSPDDEFNIRKQLRHYFTKHLVLGDFIAKLAFIEKQLVSGAFLLLQERPANLSFPSGYCATIVNVLTYPDYRKKGIAYKVMIEIIKTAKNLNISSIDLFSTEKGKILYEKLGFIEPEYTAMRLKL